MKRRRPSFGLPLLAKELAEQGARKRTYVIRSVYALLLSGLALLLFWNSVYRYTTGPFDLLGQGRELLSVLVGLQTFGIILFVPAMSSGAITSEKERNTLGLLLLTRLSPGTILLEKFLGRVFTMLMFLLLMLPLLGFCYSLGGVEPNDLWLCSLMLVTIIFQLSAMGTCCSTYFQTNVAAFLGTYLIAAAMYLLPIIVAVVLRETGQLTYVSAYYSALIDRIAQGVGESAVTATSEACKLMGITQPPFSPMPVWQPYSTTETELYFPLMPAPAVGEVVFSLWKPEPFWQTLVKLIPAWCSTVVFLVLARYFLVRRAHVSPRNQLMRIFRMLDGMFHHLNERYTRGVVLLTDTSSLPDERPIAWREVSKKSLGTVRYLVRVFLLMEVPLLTCGLLAMIFTVDISGTRHPILQLLSLLTWVLAALFIIVKAATLIAGERSGETLQVLLSTPIPAADIIRQKLVGVQRLMLTVAVPLLTITLLQAWNISVRGVAESLSQSPWFYLATNTFCILLYLPILAWLGVLIGLIVKTHSRAVLTTLIVVVAWCLLPIVVVATLENESSFFLDVHLFNLLSPATIPLLNETGQLDVSGLGTTPMIGLMVNCVLYGLIWGFLHFVTLSIAPRMLDRAEVARSDRRSFRPHRPPRSYHSVTRRIENS